MNNLKFWCAPVKTKRKKHTAGETPYLRHNPQLALSDGSSTPVNISVDQTLSDTDSFTSSTLSEQSEYFEEPKRRSSGQRGYLSVPSYLTDQQRRASAPVIIEDMKVESHWYPRRRNSSVEDRTNAIRNKLEESYLKEKENGRRSLIGNSRLSLHDRREERGMKCASVSQKNISKGNFFLHKSASPKPVRKKSLHEFTGSERRLRSRKFSLPETQNPTRKLSIPQSNNPKPKKSIQNFLSFTKKTSDAQGSHPEANTNKQRMKEDSTATLTDSNRTVNANPPMFHSNSRRRRNAADSPVRERRHSITEAFKSAVFRRTSSIDESPHNDENNNDKKTKWDILRKKGRKERARSIDTIDSPSNSPRSIRYSRQDSCSSVDSYKKRSSRNHLHRLSSYSADFDQSSLGSSSCIEEEHEDAKPFDAWRVERKHRHYSKKSLPLLHVAASEGNLELIETLSYVGVDINELDDMGWPALHYAVCSGQFQAAQLLITKGAVLQSYSNKVMNTYCSSVRECIHSG